MTSMTSDDASTALTDPLVLPEGSFAFLPAAPLRSSGRKELYRGRFTSRAGRAVGALAAFFAPDAGGAFGRECATLAIGERVGTGPGLLAAGMAARPSDGAACPVIVERDAGTPLAEVLTRGVVPGQGRADVALAAPTSELGHRQASKLLFDVMCELANLHAAGHYHRDLSSNNVAVRVIGPQPWDLRATLIDFELAATDAATLLTARTDTCYERLFSELPGVPTALELDMGYLALIACELREGLPIDCVPDAALAPYLEGELRFFRRLSSGLVFASRLEPGVDLAPLARECGLPRAAELGVGELAGVSRHAGYVDAEELRALERRADAAVIRQRDRIARAIFERYVRQSERDGRRVLYHEFDAQPADLKESNYQQAVDLVRKLRLVGCEVVPAGSIDARLRVRELDEADVERLAEAEHERWVQERLAAGWAYAPQRDVERRLSPYLVVYDELSEQIKDYDREPVRASVELLELAGLWVRRGGPHGQ